MVPIQQTRNILSQAQDSNVYLEAEIPAKIHRVMPRRWKLLNIFALLVGLSLSVIISYNIVISFTAKAAENLSSPERPKTVHFIVSSTETRLRGRQCCSLEAAARNNPSLTVVLWLRRWRPVEEICRGLSELSSIKVRGYKVEDLFAQSPLLVWLARQEGRKKHQKGSRFAPYHLADALRLSLLHKFGGTYLDLDILIMSKSSLEQLPSSACLGRETAQNLGNSFLAFPKGHRFLGDAITELATTFRGDLWAFNGPRLIERVFRRWNCSVETTVSCKDINIVPYTAFYAVPFENASLLFIASHDKSRNSTESAVPLNGAIGLHLWNSISANYSVSEGSVVHRIASVNCPITAHDMGHF